MMPGILYRATASWRQRGVLRRTRKTAQAKQENWERHAKRSRYLETHPRLMPPARGCVHHFSPI